MKRWPLTQGMVFTILTLLSLNIFAQNKNLGIGTATPNPNAVLHVESPTSNQGFIMPRLTTAQRSAMTSILTAGDQGLMLFDTDLQVIYIWSGTTWKSTAEVASLNATSANGNPAVSAQNTGTGNGVNVVMSNTSTTATGLDITQSGNGYALHSISTGTNENAWFEVQNATSSGTPVVGITNGVGVAGFFQVNNKTGGGSALQGITNSDVGGTLAPVGVYGTSSGIGSLGGSFRNTNPANTYPALYAETKGLNNTAAFKTTNAVNAFPVLYLEQTGTGPAANFKTLNSGTSAPGFVIDYAGTGDALFTTGKISAGYFVGDGSGLTNLPGAGSGWSLTGNSGTAPGTNFIGTKDANDFVIKTNDAEALRVMKSGQIGVGSTPISAKVDVAGGNYTIGLFSSTSLASASPNRALQGYSAGSPVQNFGVYGTGELNGSAIAIGVYGEAIGTGTGDATGVYATTNNFTSTTGTSYGLYAEAQNGSTNWAGFFNAGNVHVTNALSLGTPGTFGSTGQILTSQGSVAAPTWTNLSVGSAEIADGSINGGDLNSSINISTSGSISAASFTGDGSGLSNVGLVLPYTSSTGSGTTALDITNTATSGNAGSFKINNAANGGPALVAATNGVGPAMQVDQQSSGVAIDIMNGSIKHALVFVSSAGAITARSGMYQITTSGSFTLPTAAVNGESCIVYNGNGVGITVEGQAISSGQARQFIRVASVWVIVN